MTSHVSDAAGPRVTSASATTVVAWTLWGLALASYVIAVVTRGVQELDHRAVAEWPGCEHRPV